MALLFAYILGPILFGWYGFFLLPIVFVLMLEMVRILLPELFHGEPIVPEPGLAEENGADTEEMQETGADAEEMRETGADAEEIQEGGQDGTLDGAPEAVAPIPDDPDPDQA
jgi:hypothetical protein